MNKVKFSLGEHKIGYDLWLSKRHLFEAFFGEFYEFIKRKENGLKDLEKNNIKSKEDFYKFADWYAGGKDNCYSMGFAFYPYFLTVDERDENKVGVREKLADQTDETFIGYCLKNDKFVSFIEFLLSFFPYWRNDETCTCFDPYNKADQFFNSSWAVLVDTCKLFYFESDTVFHWITFRVKYCVSNILGTIKPEVWDYKEELEYEGELELPKLRVSGYKFLGWKDQNGNYVTKVKDSDLTLTADLLLVDHYDYWEKEEPKIVKVPNPNYKRVDPC